MKFRLYAGREVLGDSNLELPDESGRARTGMFFPDAGYEPFEMLFQEYSQLRYELGAETTNPRMQELGQRIKALDLSVLAPNGEQVLTSHIELMDFSHEMGDEGRQLTVFVTTREGYEKCFG